MDIPTIYSIVNQGQSSPREYIDVRKKPEKSLPIKHKRRSTYIEDIIK